jgi:hypothetical protein
MILEMTAKLALLLGAVILVSSAHRHDNEEDDEGVLEYKVEKGGEVLAGRYYRPDLNLGLRFYAERDILILRTWDKRPMITFGKKMQNKTCRLVEFSGDQFMQVRHLRERGFFGVRRDRKMSNSDIETGSSGVMNRMVARNETSRMFERAVKRLLRMPEAELIEELAIALGREGVTGKKVPASLSLYRIAMRIAKLLDEEGEEEEETGDTSRADRSVGKRGLFDIFKKCKKDPIGSDCLGRCGRGCSCWPWVCGSCCYYQGCYEHDLCCRNLYSEDCLSIWNFSCSSYSC